MIVAIDDPDDMVNVMAREQRFTKHLFRLLRSKHWASDSALYNVIEASLSPELGPCGSPPAKWFQVEHCYGWGIRDLRFAVDAFQPEHAFRLQPLLSGRFRRFGIICWAKSGPWKKVEGALIFAHKMFATADLAKRIERVQLAVQGDGPASGGPAP
jgi:hypothetical protein